MCGLQYVDPDLAPAPVTYVNKWLKGDPDTPKFLGNPSVEMDQAWHELLSATAIRFSEEELILANNATSIRLQDGGYVAGLGISHSLHCVVSLLSASNPSTATRLRISFTSSLLHYLCTLPPIKLLLITSHDGLQGLS